MEKEWDFIIPNRADRIRFLGLDFMILNDYTVKILEVNNKLGFGVINQGSDKVNQYTYDFFNWIYFNGIKPLEKFLF